MKKKIVIGSILACCMLMMMPAISAEHGKTIIDIRESPIERIEELRQIIKDSPNQNSEKAITLLNMLNRLEKLYDEGTSNLILDILLNLLSILIGLLFNPEGGGGCGGC